MANETYVDPTSAGGQIGALQQAAANRAMLSAGGQAMPGGLSSLRPQRQAEYDTAKTNLDEAYSAKSVEGDDAAMWGALAKGFAAPAQNFWQSLANAGGDKANVVAGIEAQQLKQGREVSKLEYDHASKLLQSADMLDRTVLGKSLGAGQGKFVPTGVAGTMINNVTGEKLVLQDSDKPLMGQIYLKNKELYGNADDALQATFQEIKELKGSNTFMQGKTGVKQDDPSKVIAPAAGQNTANIPAGTPTGAAQGALSGVGAGTSNPQIPPTLKPPVPQGVLIENGPRPVSTTSEIDTPAVDETGAPVQKMPLTKEMLLAAQGDMTKRGDTTGAAQIEIILKQLEKQKSAAESTGNTQLATAVQANIDRVKQDYPQTKVQKIEASSLEATAVSPEKIKEAGVPEWSPSWTKYKTTAEREQAIGKRKEAFDQYDKGVLQPMQAAVDTNTDNMNRFVELQAQNKGTQAGLWDRLPVIGDAVTNLRTAGNIRLQEMDSLSKDFALAKHVKGTGAMSDKDQAVFEKIVPGINKEPETNRNIAELTNAQAARTKEFIRYAGVVRDTYGDFNPAHIKSTFQAYADANPLFGGYDDKGRIKINKPMSFEDWFRAHPKGR